MSRTTRRTIFQKNRFDEWWSADSDQVTRTYLHFTYLHSTVTRWGQCRRRPFERVPGVKCEWPPKV